MRITAIALALLAASLVNRPAAAQEADEEPALALRPFVLVSGQVLAAKETFQAGFGQSIQPFYGGGLQGVWRGGVFLDIAASRFRKTGERAFRDGAETFRLGIPLTVAITPVEFSAGYRFWNGRAVAPYLGGGVGVYRYQETSDGSDPGEDVDTSKAGYLAVGGVDVRVVRWIRVGLDLQYTRVTGILGAGGISKQVGEDDLGGMAARLKLTVGR